jgi:hypothetical protein
VFGPKREEVTGDWRKLHIVELYDLYFSPVIIRAVKPKRMRWIGLVARMGEKRNACKILAWKTEGKRLLERHKRRWEDNITIGCKSVDWIVVGQERSK